MRPAIKPLISERGVRGPEGVGWLAMKLLVKVMLKSCWSQSSEGRGSPHGQYLRMFDTQLVSPCKQLRGRAVVNEAFWNASLLLRQKVGGNAVVRVCLDPCNVLHQVHRVCDEISFPCGPCGGDFFHWNFLIPHPTHAKTYLLDFRE